MRQATLHTLPVALLAVTFLATGCLPATPVKDLGSAEVGLNVLRYEQAATHVIAFVSSTDGSCLALDADADLNGERLEAYRGGTSSQLAGWGYVSQSCKDPAFDDASPSPDLVGQPLVLTIKDASGAIRLRSEEAASFQATEIVVERRAGVPFEFSLSRPVPGLNVKSLTLENEQGGTQGLSAEVSGDRIVAGFPSRLPGTYRWELITTLSATADECAGIGSCRVETQDTFRGETVVK